MGLHLSLTIYNIFVLPILTFVAQLQHSSRATLLAESKANTKIAPGPAACCSMADLQHLKNIHAHTEARNLTTTAHAAMLRTALWENHAQGGIQWTRMKQELIHAQQHSPHLGRAGKHHDWHNHHMATTLHNHKQQMATQNIDQHHIRQTLTKQAQLPLTNEDHTTWKNKRSF